MQLALLLACLLPLLFIGARSDAISTLAVIFLSIVFEALPFMLLGALVGGLIEEFVPRDKVNQLLPEGRLSSVLLAAAMGIVFPVCECAIVSVVRRLLRKGIPLSAAVAYLLAGPVFNPIVAASTLVAYQFDWRMVCMRLGFVYGIAVVVGVLMGRLFAGRTHEVLLPVQGHDHGHEHGHPRDWRSRCVSAIRHGADEFFEVAPYLVMGAFAAAVIQTFLSRQALLSLTSTPLAYVPAMMGLAIVLNLCSEADAFVAASFRTMIPLSGQMAFLVLGPMLDLKLLAMYRGVFRVRGIAVLVLLVLTFVLSSMLLFDAWIRT